jgi:ABC-type nickel/cobalt efflux system permease component RcnA
LLVAGILTILLQIAIPERLAGWLEFVVALMIIILGSRVLYLVLRRRTHVHVHTHAHDGHTHTHLHFHDDRDAHSLRNMTSPESLSSGTHHARPLGWKPLLVGMMHGLAGSAALTLLVLTEIVRDGSRALGLVYLFIFGVGSIGGMLLMSALISLPFVFTAARFERFNTRVRLIAGLSSVAFGLYYAWEMSASLVN